MNPSPLCRPQEPGAPAALPDSRPPRTSGQTPLALVLAYIWKRAHAPDARFSDVVALILVTADWSQIPQRDADAAEAQLVEIAERLDADGVSPSTVSREALRRALSIASNDLSQPVLNNLADLLVLAGSRNPGAYQ